MIRYNIKFLNYFKYITPITSVDVEYTFSLYKNILNNRLSKIQFRDIFNCKF
jgi:hypothetical protein